MGAGEGGDRGHREGQTGLSGTEGPAEVRDHKFVVASNPYPAPCWHIGCVQKYLKDERINTVV